MRVYLNASELRTEVGKQLLELTVRIASDGKLELPEIKELRQVLRDNKENKSIVAIDYLNGIMERITADGMIDREELLELHLAIERVIPSEYRSSIVKARKERETVRRDHAREVRRLEKEREKEERKRTQDAEYARQMRLRHSFAKVAGVTFPNDDGSERQHVLKRCVAGEHLILQHDATNAYSRFAVKILRTNGEQIGRAPEYLAERIFEEGEEQYLVSGVLTDVTGGSWDKPTLGANFVVFFIAQDVSNEEFQHYASGVLANRDG